MSLKNRAKVAKKAILIEATIVLFLWVIATPFCIIYGGGHIAVSIAGIVHCLVALSYIFYLAPVCLAAWMMGYDY